MRKTFPEDRQNVSGSSANSGPGQPDLTEPTALESNKLVLNKIEELKNSQFANKEKLKLVKSQFKAARETEEISIQRIKKKISYKGYIEELKLIINSLRDLYDWDGKSEDMIEHVDYRSGSRKRCHFLYSPVLLYFTTYLSLVTVFLEMFFVIGLMTFPSTFVPLFHGGSMAITGLIFFFHAVFLFICFILGRGLHVVKSWEIGLVIPTWPLPVPLFPFIQLLLVVICWYGSQDWRISREMHIQMAGYNHYRSTEHPWDGYQIKMECCGINDYKDWEVYGPEFELASANLVVPESCCKISNCNSGNLTDETIFNRGCLIPTLVLLKLIFSLGAMCLICNFILSFIAFLSKREAQQYKGDPLFKRIFTSQRGDKTGDKVEKIRFRELIDRMNFCCYEIGKHLGLGEIIHAVDHEEAVEAIDRFLSHLRKHPELWKDVGAEEAWNDITIYLEHMKRLRENNFNKLKDLIPIASKTNLNPNKEIVNGLDDVDYDDNFIEKTYIDPLTRENLPSPLEIAQVMHALDIHPDSPQGQNIVSHLAEKLSTIFEEDENVKNEIQSDENIPRVQDDHKEIDTSEENHQNQGIPDTDNKKVNYTADTPLPFNHSQAPNAQNEDQPERKLPSTADNVTDNSKIQNDEPKKEIPSINDKQLDPDVQDLKPQQSTPEETQKSTQETSPNSDDDSESIDKDDSSEEI